MNEAQTIDAVLAWAQSGLRPEDANLVRAEADAGEEFFAFIDAISISESDGPALPNDLRSAVRKLAKTDRELAEELRAAAPALAQ